MKADDASKGRRLYAVQVNNAIESAEARYVSSSYELTLNKGTFEIDSDWDFVVKTPLATKHVSDNRCKKDVILGVQGQNITISIVKEAAASDYKTPSIAAMYVILDKANAVESLGSKINAWNAYTYTGLNEVVKGTSTTIKVDYSSSVNDIIGFRVFAVNHDGKLVDPDGRAFYVRIGDPAIDWSVAATSIVATSTDGWKGALTEKVAIEMSKISPTKVKFTMDDKNEPFKVFFYEKNATSASFALVNNETWSAASGLPSFDKYVTLAAQPVQEWYKYEDGKAYYGTLTAYDVTSFEIGTLRVSFTKNIPTAAPEGFSIKTNQVEGGAYNCYLIPENWEATKGTMAMDQIFNFPAEAIKANYSIKFATTKYNSDNKDYTDVMSVAGTNAVNVAAALIDNETKHATTATYDYGYISSVKHAAAVAAGKRQTMPLIMLS